MRSSRGAGPRRNRLLAAFGITLTVLVVEVVGSLATNSLALLADAGHMMTDAAGVGIALFAIHVAARPADDRRTFGMYRLEILAAVVNAVLLFGVAGYVLLEAWPRFVAPRDVASGPMLAVALVGLAANAASVGLLQRGQAASLNVRGAYLEALGDLLGSAAVVVAAAVMALTGFRLADPVASVFVGVLILPRTWKLLREAVDVLLEATPKGMDLSEIRRHILHTPGVADVHDLHAWTITSGLPVLSAHVVVGPAADPAGVLAGLCACLSGHFDIEHSTFQLETEDRRRLEATGHS